MSLNKLTDCDHRRNVRNVGGMSELLLKAFKGCFKKTLFLCIAPSPSENLEAETWKKGTKEEI